MYIIFSPPFCRCKIPGLDNDTYEVQDYGHEVLINATIPAGLKFQYDRCHVFATQNGNSSQELVECTEWVYDASLYKHTFTKQVVKIHVGVLLWKISAWII